MDYFGGFGPTHWDRPGLQTANGSRTPGNSQAVNTLSLFTRWSKEDLPGHRWDERCAVSRVRQEREVSVLHSFDQLGPRRRLAWTCPATNIAITRSVYVTVLSKDEKSPLAPESDEEKAKDEAKADADKNKPRITRAKRTRAREKTSPRKQNQPTRIRRKIKTRTKTAGKKGRARCRQDRYRWHRPAHSVAAHSCQELPRTCSREKPAYCSLLRAH